MQATSNMSGETKQHESDDNNSSITSQEVDDLMLAGFQWALLSAEEGDAAASYWRAIKHAL